MRRRSGRPRRTGGAAALSRGEGEARGPNCVRAERQQADFCAARQSSGDHADLRGDGAPRAAENDGPPARAVSAGQRDPAGTAEEEAGQGAAPAGTAGGAGRLRLFGVQRGRPEYRHSENHAAGRWGGNPPRRSDLIFARRRAERASALRRAGNDGGEYAHRRAIFRAKLTKAKVRISPAPNWSIGSPRDAIEDQRDAKNGPARAGPQ